MQTTPTNSTSIDWARHVKKAVQLAGILDDSVEITVGRALLKVPINNIIEEQLPTINVESPIQIGDNRYILPLNVITRMLGLIGLNKGMRILELGGGAGYISAVMAAAGAYVFSVEHEGHLAQSTRKKLDLSGFQNIIVNIGDETKGWPEHGPYDGIICSSPIKAANKDLLSQLATPGGKMVGPILENGSYVLHMWESKLNGISSYSLEGYNFSVNE